MYSCIIHHESCYHQHGYGHTPDNTAMRLKFGSYVQVSEDCDPSNTARAHDSLNVISTIVAPTRTGNTRDEDSTLCPKHRVPVYKTNGSNYPYRTPPLRGLKHLHLPKANPSFRRRAVWLSNGVQPDHPIDTDKYDRNYRPQSNVAKEENLLPRDCNPILDSYRPRCTRR